MKEVITTLSTLLWYMCEYETSALSLPGPQVYVVTPSPRLLQNEEGRSASRPFYYHNWMRRMDSPPNMTTTTTTTPKVKTPDLIFAEFESDKMKNIRKLLEKERIKSKTSTFKPIYVPDEDIYEDPQNINYGLSEKREENKPDKKDTSNNNALYDSYGDVPPAPVYLPSTTSSTITTISASTAATVNNVENIWHIIDSEKQNQYSGTWDEVPINSDSDQDSPVETNSEEDKGTDQNIGDTDSSGPIDENFALPGFVTNPVNGAENESRAIRTDPNIRFPYVNLKPFQMKNLKKPFNDYVNSKKGNNMYSSLDNFFELKNPVRGEVQDPTPVRQPVDRYNPAQPYLPSSYGSKSKQGSPSSNSMKTVSNLVPPPPPQAPKVTADDFPAPISYESFPPYPPASFDLSQLQPPPALKPSPAMSSPPSDSPKDSDSSNDSDSPSPSNDNADSPPPDMVYRYKPPSPPALLPTLPPLTKPKGGYSYGIQSTADSPPDDGPDFYGYHYEKPPPPMPDKPDFHGYHYSRPEPPAPPMDHPPISYGHHVPPSYQHDSEYPELIYDKPHGMDDNKGGDDMKGDDDMKANDMGMVPPPPPPDMKPDMAGSGPSMDDTGFPSDFPGFHHGFDDHDFYHHHHHHTTTTTTTTTTEMPRVNRYSYYYLGKKLYYLPLYFSVYFIIYVGALIIKAVLRHKIVYPNSWRPNDSTSSFFSKRSVDSWDLSNENLHEVTGKVTHAIATAAEKYINSKKSKSK